MRKEVTVVTVTCDLCGKDTEARIRGARESEPEEVLSIRYEIYYGGTYELRDFCKECRATLVKFLHDHGARGRGTKL